jgi:flagellar motor component MotA
MRSGNIPRGQASTGNLGSREFMFFYNRLIGSRRVVLGGYLPHGDPLVLFQPLELLIIGGAAIGAYIIANPKTVIFGTFGHVKRVLGGPPHDQDSYLELLTLLYTVFRLTKSKGMLALELHLEVPEDSPLFQPYPSFFGQPSRGRVSSRLSAADDDGQRQPQRS